MSRALSLPDAKLRGYSEAAIRRMPAGRDAQSAELEAGRPEPPPHLSDAEKKIFEHALDLLEKRGTLTLGDAPVLALYAQTVAEHRAERDRLNDEGRVIIVNRLDKHGHAITVHAVNPRARIVRDLEKQLTMLLRELGLTPLRRHQIRRTANRKLSMDELLRFPGGAS